MNDAAAERAKPSGLAVSVVIPTFNRGHLIERAIRSVLAELQDRDEVFVVDDGSTDKTGEVVARFPRVTYLTANHGGAGKARNIGMRAANNPLVAFLDSDDEWLPGALTLKRTLLKAHPELVFCFSNFAGTTRDGSLHHGALLWWHQDTRAWDQILGRGEAFSSLAALPAGSVDVRVHIGSLARNEMTANYVAVNTVVVRRDRAAEALQFPEDLPTYEDWECFGRLSLKGDCAYLDLETAVQHYHAGPRLTDASRLLRATTRIIELQRVWGSDADFLREHREAYEATLFEQRKDRVYRLLITGQRREVQAELKSSGDWPFLYRLMSTVPGWLTLTMVNATRWVKRAILRH